MGAESVGLPPIGLIGRIPWPSVMGAAFAVAVIVPAAAGQGGFFPVAWGWMGLAFAWIAITGLVLPREVRLSHAELAIVAGALVVTLWTAAGMLWTSSVTSTMLELEHNLAYLAFVGAAVVVGERSSAIALLVGTWAAITAVALYSLSTHLAPVRFGFYQDPIEPGRLFQPIGYWNALGIFCVMGIAIALGLADRHGPLMIRCITAASIAPLAATTYFTFSRGAWAALGVAIAAVIALTPGRLRYIATALVVLPAPAVAVAYAASLPHLTASTVRPAQVTVPGLHAAIAIGVGAAVAAASALMVALVQRRLVVPVSVRHLFKGLLLVLAVGMMVTAVARYGSPLTQAHRAYRSLTTPPPASSNLNSRLLSLSLESRLHLWRAAASDFQEHPVVGSGPGTYGAYWLAHRSSPDYVQDAHSLYVETLAEQGVVGLAALLTLLVPPLVVAVRLRAVPAVPIGFGAYVAYLTHAMVDWDWEVSAVTIVALIAAVAIVLSSPERLLVPTSVRVPMSLALASVGALAVLGLVGNRALSEGVSALGRGDTAAALNSARQAKRFAPWSDAPYILAGRAQLEEGRRSLAASSFLEGTQKEPTDWEAWQWVARATSGRERATAVVRLKSLDPLYDFVNGRP